MPEPIVNLRDANGNTKAYLDYDSSTGELVLHHTDSGEEWTYNPSNSRWDGGSVGVGGVTDTSRSPERDAWSSGSITLTVGTDFPTLQECLDAIPLIPYHNITIDVPSGTDLSTEDVLVPQLHAGQGTVGGRGFEHKVEVVGDATTPSNNPLGSLVVAGVTGGYITFDGFEFQHDNPHDNENAVVSAYHSTVALRACSFAGGTDGVLSYGSGGEVNLEGVDFGASVLTGDAIKTKHFGRVVDQSAGLGPSSGTVQGYAYRATNGLIHTDLTDSTLSGSTGQINLSNEHGGMVTDRLAAGAPFVAQLIGNYNIDGEWETANPGDGYRVRTPDGTDKYRIRVDNSGNVDTDLL